eukprot:CAMPEP_0114459676 /NCGR_PEP_ID=MMETSP0104-20121206/5331_1 /TAXON_ID=37642 ORGANISM="Paraphysomonas imperforata, Strain PA2" /NCGR_SAMPLE_ID=MMETSP0104 /ASSEMBLY_ACC=CAM_ASM_000202 /LENGTH=961 /DNA_ID=CAMNT_0001632321 /DNA_START=1122 /DNA_END=4007 /DNA_ORIENTATION=-
MSVICSVIHWLKSEEQRIIESVSAKADKTTITTPKTTSSSSSSAATSTISSASTGIDWLDDFISSNSEDNENKRLQQDAVELREALLHRIQRKRTMRPLPLRHKHLYGGGATIASSEEKATETDEIVDDDVLCHYNSDEEAHVDSRISKVAVAYESDGDTEATFSPHQAKDLPEDDKKRVDLDPLIAYVDTHLHMPKIYYCSRTHSQLAQFAAEIKKATASSSSSIRCITLGSRRNMCINSSVSTPFASDAAISEKCLDMQRSKSKSTPDSGGGGSSKKRKRMTGSESSESSPGADNNNKSSSGKCAYHSASAEQHFMEHAMGNVRDIEELVVLGEAVNACPYYGSRKALAQAQIVCLPYNLMLSEQSRAALGISLEHNVVIFDEAHNIVEAVNMVHSAELSFAQIRVTMIALKTYLRRFRNVLNGKNFYYLNLLISMAQSFLKVIKDISGKSVRNKQSCIKEPEVRGSKSTGKNISTIESDFSNVYTVNEFVFLSTIDNVNLRKIARYVEVTHLVRKIGGYVDNEIKRANDSLKEGNEMSSSKKGKGDAKPASQKEMKTTSTNGRTGNSVLNPALLSTSSSTINSLRSFFGLLAALHNEDADGRIFISSSFGTSGSESSDADENSYSMQYVLLNPASHFSDIVNQSRSVLFLGGTLQPFDLISSSLFPKCGLGCPTNATTTCSSSSTVSKSVDKFSCSHIIPSSHIATFAVRSGPSNIVMDFRHGSRDNDQLVRELFLSVYQISAVVPHGVVLFFTSYAYMDLVVAAWKRMMLTPQLGAIKHICVEQRKSGSRDDNKGTKSDQGMDAWAKYCSHIHDSINHASRKGAILLSVMGGKLSEGINFSDDLARAVIIVGMPYPDLSDMVLKEKLSFAERIRKGSSRIIYEGMCMKSVNQSIGRAIRHIGDYASVVLLDHRYTQSRVQSQLPSWILKSKSDERNIFHSLSFQDSLAKIEQFFASK